MDSSQSTVTPRIQKVEGGGKKKSKGKVSYDIHEEYVIKNTKTAINEFKSHRDKGQFMKNNLDSTMETINESGMKKGYWIVVVLTDEHGMRVSIGYLDELDGGAIRVGPNAKYFPANLAPQEGGKKKKARKVKKGKKNKTKKGKKKGRKGKKKTKKKRR